MITIVVDNRVRLSPAEDLPSNVVRELQAAFRHDNPEYAKKKSMGYATYNEPPVYKTWEVHRRGEGDGTEHDMSFPRGGLSRVRAILDGARIKYKVKDKRTSGSQHEFKTRIPDHLYTLYDYQREALEAALAKQNCIIRAPTGSGKTTIAFAIGSTLKLPTLVIVWAGNLHEQWIKRAKKELGLDAKDVGVIREGKRILKPLTVAMQQTLATQTDEEWDEIREVFGVVVCDELQRFAAPTLFESVDPFPAKYRIGISADETRKDRKEFLTYDLFGQIAADIPRNKLIASGHVLDVESLIIPTTFDSKVKGDFDALLAEMVSDPSREAIVDEMIMREVAKGEQVIVFTQRREHAMRIDQRLAQNGIKSGILLGGKSHEAIFAKTVAGLESGELRVGVGTIQAMGQGLDIPWIGVGVIALPVGNNRQLYGQIRGRMCRAPEGKTSARLYYLWDKFYYGARVVENLIRWNNAPMVKVLHGTGETKVFVQAKEFMRQLRGKRKAAS